MCTAIKIEITPLAESCYFFDEVTKLHSHAIFNVFVKSKLWTNSLKNVPRWSNGTEVWSIMNQYKFIFEESKMTSVDNEMFQALKNVLSSRNQTIFYKMSFGFVSP